MPDLYDFHPDQWTTDFWAVLIRVLQALIWPLGHIFWYISLKREWKNLSRDKKDVFNNEFSDYRQIHSYEKIAGFGFAKVFLCNSALAAYLFCGQEVSASEAFFPWFCTMVQLATLVPLSVQSKKKLAAERKKLIVIETAKLFSLSDELLQQLIQTDASKIDDAMQGMEMFLPRYGGWAAALCCTNAIFLRRSLEQYANLLNQGVAACGELYFACPLPAWCRPKPAGKNSDIRLSRLLLEAEAPAEPAVIDVEQLIHGIRQLVKHRIGYFLSEDGERRLLRVSQMDVKMNVLVSPDSGSRKGKLTSEYQSELQEQGSISPKTLAVQLLVGFPTDKNMILSIAGAVTRILQTCLLMLLFVVITILPTAKRYYSTGHLVLFAPKHFNLYPWFGGVGFTIMLPVLHLSIIPSYWVATVWVLQAADSLSLFTFAPMQLSRLFTRAQTQMRALNLMLQGPQTAGSSCLPAAQSEHDLLVWSELHALCSSTVKPGLERLERHLGISICALALYSGFFVYHVAVGNKDSTDTTGLWRQVVAVSLFAFLLTALPSLALGVMTNSEIDKGKKLAAQNYMELRRYLAHLSLQGAHASNPDKLAQVQQAVDLAHCIQQSLQQDETLNIKVLGVKLTSSGLISLASAGAALLTFISRNFPLGDLPTKVMR